MQLFESPRTTTFPPSDRQPAAASNARTASTAAARDIGRGSYGAADFAVKDSRGEPRRQRAGRPPRALRLARAVQVYAAIGEVGAPEARVEVDQPLRRHAHAQEGVR